MPIAAIRNRGDVDVEIANAELVVRAANSYAKLLSALEAITQALAKRTRKGREAEIQAAWEQGCAAIADAKTLPTAPEPKANTGR